MSIPYKSVNGVKIYDLTADKTMPQWLSEKSKDKLRKDKEYQRHVELIQGFDFPTASQRISEAKNQETVLVSGVYPPQIHCYEYSQMSQKWRRHVDCEIVDFLLLNDDWTKIAMLEADRTVEFHTQSGNHFKTRIPKFGRAISYHAPSCDLLLAANGAEMYRLNLELGRFMTPLITASNGLNCVDTSKILDIIALGGESGVLECWDPSSKKSIGSVDTRSHIAAHTFGVDSNAELTTIKFHDRDPLCIAVGTSTGHVCLYDIRKNIPRIVKDHQYGTPINQIRFLNDERTSRIASSDTKGIKIWDESNGKPFSSVETGSDVSDFCCAGSSGMFFVTGESARVKIVFIPDLGPAPKWCSFVDNYTEEQEDEAPVIYDDFKFITREEIAEIGLDHLHGTPLLRAYMHGFFVDSRLYNKAKSLTDPVSYESYRRNAINKKIDAERSNRISLRRRIPKPKVNPEMGKSELVGDSRFGKLFENPDFTIDRKHDDYVRLHASGTKESVPHNSESESEEEQDEAPAQFRPTEFNWAESDKKKEQDKQVLGDRMESQDVEKRPVTAGHMVSFVPKTSKKLSDRAQSEIAHKKEALTRRRRGVKELKLSKGGKRRR